MLLTRRQDREFYISKDTCPYTFRYSRIIEAVVMKVYKDVYFHDHSVKKKIRKGEVRVWKVES